MADLSPSRPQIYDWSHVPEEPSFTTRMVLPFFSTRYKTDMTAHCLLRGLTERVVPLDEQDVAASDTAQLLQRHPELARAPKLKPTFNRAELFSLYHARFRRAAPLLFHTLRSDCYRLCESHYQQQFAQSLRPVDGLGFSGSLFFYTHDKSLIIKSVGRQFEYQFLYEKMLDSFASYCSTTDSQGQPTLLCQITDVLASFDYRLGDWLGISPSHYVVMANVLEGLDTARGCRKWDLKPQSFFEPTRDLVPDPVKTEQAKSGLADELDDEIVLTRREKSLLMQQTERDTAFLQDMKTIDYSLLLGRYPVDMFHPPHQDGGERDPMALPAEGTTDFVRGIRSADGKWVYKMVLLDFFWNTEQLMAKVVKAAGKLLPEQTVTTEPERYRKEFLRRVSPFSSPPSPPPFFFLWS